MYDPQPGSFLERNTNDVQRRVPAVRPAQPAVKPWWWGGAPDAANADPNSLIPKQQALFGWFARGSAGRTPAADEVWPTVLANGKGLAWVF